MKTKDVSKLARKLYIEIEEKGIDRVKELFSKGKTLPQELKFDANEEYLKKMIISQLNIGRMLMSHNIEIVDLMKELHSIVKLIK